ncbi:MAG: shikimate dehydrogenase [Lachnospiraceae bacterium]|nr:shikimate dehydrogenase [Lachnospiraceae bacterium]
MSKNYRAELVGVFGDPVDDNPTGVMEESAFEYCGLNYRYLTLRVTPDDLGDAVRAIRAFHMKGINLTMPHKINVIPKLDGISEAAQIIGAVNTVVVKEDNSLYGENTDGKGFVQALNNRGISLAGKKLLILGAGGAARAVSVECALAGAEKITILNRTEDKATELAGVINNNTPAKAEGYHWTPGYRIPEETDILVNATSIGFSPDINGKPDIDYDSIHAGMTVVDVVFYPCETLFLKEAAKRGAETVNGLGMLACQGALNFTLWTGVPAPLEVMEEQLRKEFI